MKGYQLIDSGHGSKLERFGEITIQRPAAQAVWARRDPGIWGRATSRFERGERGYGQWIGRIPRQWEMEHDGISWQVEPNEHGNVGVFAEQTECWQWIRNHTKPGMEVLNLFAYTGGSTLAAASAGARVVHLDASKTSVATARKNAESSGLASKPVRWIIDDAVKFVERDIRRGRRYQGIILDPPSYGRGNKGEIWQIENDMLPFLEKVRELLADDAAYVLLSSHSPGFTPIALANLIDSPGDSSVERGEMVIGDEAGRLLPSGAYGRWWR